MLSTLFFLSNECPWSDVDSAGTFRRAQTLKLGGVDVERIGRFLSKDSGTHHMMSILFPSKYCSSSLFLPQVIVLGFLKSGSKKKTLLTSWTICKKYFTIVILNVLDFKACRTNFEFFDILQLKLAMM